MAKKEEAVKSTTVEAKPVKRDSPSFCPACGTSGVKFPYAEDAKVYFCPKCRVAIY